MSFFHVFTLILLFWVIVHIIHRIYQPTRVSTLLPTLNTVAPRARLLWAEKSTILTLNKANLRIQTNAFNARHDYLAGKFKDRRFARLQKGITTFYNIGVAAGMCGMVLGLAVLFWATGSSLFDAFITAPRPSNLSKRDLTSTDPETSPAATLIQPIIPGVTVPLSHLPIILIAVFLCQIVHELGHAVAGALSSVPILSSGLSLTFIIPSAFVSFSAAFMNPLDAIAKARIIAAGPWHNLVFWILLLTLAKVGLVIETTSGLGTTLMSVCWKDVSQEGRVVVGIDNDSPLNEVLHIGSVVNALDDVSLADKEDRWSEYLTQKSSESIPWYGWCVSKQTFQASPDDCCKDGNPTLDHLCFDSLGPLGKSCLNPISTLSNSTDILRCHRETDCGEDAACIWPDSPILRLSVKGQDLILWSGPRKEIWEQVSIGRYAPRFWFIPASLLGFFTNFYDYLQMATLSLFFFNLLPLPHLDGAQFLATVLEYFLVPSLELGSTPMDVESGISTSQRSGPSAWRRRLENFVQLFAVWLVVLYILLTAMKLL
ncbi:hypothetical protein GYMLUDRAFT_83340 [Collybiopsis luxurians FD-317 M1]|uniref:Endopeptidase S2P n=1 Tax=Collybiopsis luxurians FD-317 M1 TaxID=944289 RepID=A0A0D0BIK0_9AGAR|nr:hypothetical protein GYMLUDRAFT_83340 [Collybiopsis luxurians FD-317 M1]